MAPGLAVRPQPGRERGEVLPPHAARRERGRATATCSKLVSAAHLEGFYHRPRMDKELLAEHAEGVHLPVRLPVLGAGGRRCWRARTTRAREVAAAYRDIFGPTATSSRCRTTASPTSTRSCGDSSRSATSWASPSSPRTTSHYTLKEDAKPHDVLLCIQQKKLQSDPKRLKFDSEEFYLKSAEEMRAAVRRTARRVRPDAADRRARRARSRLRGPGARRSALPPAAVRDAAGARPRRLPPPAGGGGLAERYGEVTPEIRARIDHELEVIISMGFGGYFLIVWDLIRYAREQGIRVGPGRGSAAGSVVSYCLRITDLDPLAVRPAVRAVPQPRPHPDARHRHGLRRAPS